MSDSTEAYSTTILLQSLGDDDLALLKPHFSRKQMAVEQTLLHADRPIEHVWFPEGGVASIVAMTQDHGWTEVGIFGWDGFAGTALLLGSDQSPHEVFIQVDGHTGLRIEADRFLEAVERSVTLRKALLRYVQTLLVQSAQSAVSNAHQRIEARLARWILMCHDRMEGDEIALTHKFMAMMIAAERSGVTVSLHVLEGAGLIRSKRGRVVVLDRHGLQELSGDGYGQPEAEYRRLIGPFGKTAPLAAAA